MTAALLIAAALGAWNADALTLRGGREAPQASITSVDADGVRIGPPVDTVVGWDLVDTLPAQWQARAKPLAPTAEALWRGRARLARGDFGGAERALEPLLPTFRGMSGPGARLVSEGLLRCRLERGARASAVDAWLVWVAATQEPKSLWLDSGRVDTPAEHGAPTTDPSTRLAPLLPPLWLDVPAVRPLASMPVPAGEGLAALLARAYRAAARFETGAPAEAQDAAQDTDLLARALGAGPLEALDTPEAGLRFVCAVVLARVGDEAQRPKARAALSALASSRPEPWAEAWSRVALGRSLLRESDQEQRLAGVLELLHVPARIAETDPYLTGIALAEAVVALDGLGDPASASRLFDEFASAAPDHPAWDWAPIRQRRRSPAQAPTPPADTTDPEGVLPR